MKANNRYAGYKSGFIAIIGAPNVGKSTLLNSVLGEKISITSKKPQTTRNRILGVLTKPSSQFVFLDTPGVFKAKTRLNQRIVQSALGTISEVDIILVIADVSAPDPASKEYLLMQLQKQKKPVILALNKIDLVEKKQLLADIKRWADAYPFYAVVPISAKHKTQLDDLLNEMEAQLPHSPPLFPEQTLTDLPSRFIAAEIIREKVFRLTGQEIPYSTAVTIDSFKENKKDAFVKIFASIHVERDSQKGIIIGNNGSKLKMIGQKARIEIENMLNSRVYLKLFVRVQKNWSKDTKALARFGY